MSFEVSPASVRSSAPQAASSALVRVDYRDRYAEILRSNLPEPMRPFAEFFSNLSRLGTLATALRDHIGGTGNRVLNVGSGLFASEIFIAWFQEQTVVAFDYTEEFAAFFPLFRKEVLLGNTTFLRADARSVAFRPESFDVVIIHDVLYETGLEAAELIRRSKEFLKPGGVIYLDFMNLRTRWLWRLLGKEREYRRYRLEDIIRDLESNGFQCTEWRPCTGGSSRGAALFHTMLRRFFRTSNAIAVIARKRTDKASPR